MNRLILLLVSLSSLLFFSCEKNNEEDKKDDFEVAEIFGIEGPVSGRVSEEIKIKVDLGVGSCNEFKLEAKSIGTAITLIAYKRSRQGACLHDVRPVFTYYSFIPDRTGTFTLRFTKLDKSYLVHTVAVEN